MEMYNRLPEMEYERIVEIADLISVFVEYMVDRSVKNINDQKTYEWLYRSMAGQGAEIQALNSISETEEEPEFQEPSFNLRKNSVLYPAINQDFRFWQMQFTDMRIGDWFVALPYVVMFTFCYYIMGLALNYGTPDDCCAKKDMAGAIVVNSLGVWGLSLFCFVMWFVNWKGAAISDFTLSYSMQLFVPLTVIVSKKVYKMTRSVWLGSFINAMLLAWTLVCSAGIADIYYGQSIFAILFGA